MLYSVSALNKADANKPTDTAVQTTSHVNLCNDCNGVGKHSKIKRGFDAKENERPADVSQKDHVSEPVAANTELELNGKMLAFAVTASLVCSVWCFVNFIQQEKREKNWKFNWVWNVLLTRSLSAVQPWNWLVPYGIWYILKFFSGSDQIRWAFSENAEQK